MHIRMLETRRGSEDGHVVRLYVRGEVYAVTESLAFEFIIRNYAEPVVAPESLPSTH